MSRKGELFNALHELEVAAADLRAAMTDEAARRVDLALLQLGMAMKRVEHAVIALDAKAQ